MNYRDGLETTRLTTRFLNMGAIPALTEFFGDPVNTTFLPNPKMLSKEERANELITIILNRYKENGSGLQGLILKDTGEFIGMCGLLRQDVGGKEEIEVGYHLLRKYWGKGYATEAAQKFRDIGFQDKWADTIISIIHPLNFASKNVARRNGMTLRETGILFRGNECDIFSISRKEWEKLFIE